MFNFIKEKLLKIEIKCNSIVDRTKTRFYRRLSAQCQIELGKVDVQYKNYSFHSFVDKIDWL
jgi:hypothetical protein